MRRPVLVAALAHGKLESAEDHGARRADRRERRRPAGPRDRDLSGGVVKVRDADLVPGASLAISVTATTPCSAATLTWSATAKSESAPFLPGSPLTLDAATATATRSSW